ncbi:MAG: hypothetical protein OSA98_16570, partial [Rubripirellula sp.]|nr:hypothetical protein [Rubripirellula sp.]
LTWRYELRLAVMIPNNSGGAWTKRRPRYNNLLLRSWSMMEEDVSWIPTTSTTRRQHVEPQPCSFLQ